MKLICNVNNPPLGGYLTAFHIKSKETVDISWGDETVLSITSGSIKCESSNDLSRTLSRVIKSQNLHGVTSLEKTEVDHWLSFCIGPLSSSSDFEASIDYLNKTLAPVTFLVAKHLTIADLSVFATLYVNSNFQQQLKENKLPTNIVRWYTYINSLPSVHEALKVLPSDAQKALFEKNRTTMTKQNATNFDANVGGRNQEGKFIDLPGAEMGKVIVRFPPEASGYLHIGHAKAALLNQYYQQAFNGKLIMRFDDTNPAKENVEFEKVILEDVEMLEIKPDLFTHTSNYFDLMIEYCEKLLKEGKAYVDDTEPELMKQQREQRQESVNRNNTFEKNMQMWQEMKKGTEKGQHCCVRAKIDMGSANGCLRDPTIYRCKNEPHPRTGTKYKVYPTYDFACPIVDAIEGVTHTLRTMEYHDRDDQFYWFIEALGLRRPYIWEYSRLSMTNTVLSKRKLTWFVQEGLVDGWDDPRMPTVRGVLRRGMTVEGLKQFIIAQGSSRSVVFMEWDKIWAFNKKVIDPIAPKLTALEYNNPVPVFVENAKLESFEVPKHQKNPAVGNKTVWTGPKLLIDYADAETFKEGDSVTFMSWGNLKILKINKEKGKIISVNAKPNLEDKDFKKYMKITWLCETEAAPFTPCHCVYFDHIISKPLLGKDEDFKKYIGHNTRTEVQMIGDPELRSLKAGDIIQLLRRGFFRVDVPYAPFNEFTCKEQPVILFSIPDGHTKDSSITTKLQTKSKTEQSNDTTSKSADQLNAEIQKQGSLVRELKAAKASKPDIDKAVELLKKYKSEYKNITGAEWKPVTESTTKSTTSPPTSNVSNKENELLNQISQQGEKVRKLKSDKADKNAIDAEVKTLLTLKAEYKSASGKDWNPNIKPTNVVAPSSNNEVDLLEKIRLQGEKVRNLKTQKADKSSIDAQIKILLSLKAEFKTLTGTDWSPNIIPKTPTVNSSTDATNNESAVLEKIKAQGDQIRNLKSQKADKSVIDNEVKVLLNLKSEYKAITGTDWTPNAVAKPTSVVPKINESNSEGNEASILRKIKEQGDKIRNLKSQKADKATIDVEVKTLLSLKEDFKRVTGKDWKPDMQPTIKESATPNASNDAVASLTESVQKQGDLVRSLKSNKGPKEEVDAAVKKLLDLKAEYKKLTGTDFPVAGRAPSKPKEAKPTKEKTPPAKKTEKAVESSKDDAGGVKKQTRLGLEAKKSENLAEWYSQVITKGELIEYYNVSGCYIYRPWSFSIWEAIRDWFDCEIKKLGVQNCYFPIFVSKSVLEKEKTHIADFAPEVAWVTKSGNSDMAEPVAVRPTSETVMYPSYAKWIQSHRDLPIKLNQWNNVVRWEFKHPQPFIRTREFLWQEGHTAYATKEEAADEVMAILDLYARIYTDLLAIPVVKGRKTEKEKFAGGDYTTTVEAYVAASGRGIQGATSHHLGQNFSKMFEIIYEDPETKEKKYVYQNSWGISTRSIGAMILVHSDDQGLVLPPNVASVQIVVVPCGITVSLSEADRQQLQESCNTLEKDLLAAGVRVKGDYRDNYSPGWKFNHWELKGVPIRIELGPKDIKNEQLVAVRRDTGEKLTLKRKTAVEELVKLLKEIHQNLFDRATKELNEHKVLSTNWSHFCGELEKKNIILSPFCGDKDCEEVIKTDSTRDEGEGDSAGPSMGAKSLCIPFEQPAPIKASDKCINPKCTRKPINYTLFGRSY